MFFQWVERKPPRRRDHRPPKATILGHSVVDQLEILSETHDLRKRLLPHTVDLNDDFS